MIRLGVNIDHVATLRQARGEKYPSILAAAHAAMMGGADLITVHLREDRRHIQDRDVELLRERLDIPLNLEMACTEPMIAFAKQVKPDIVCLVPESREEITTEGGLDVGASSDALQAAIATLREAGIPTSLFVDPDEQALLDANAVGASAVELHTGRYANARAPGARMREYLALAKAARTAKDLGMHVHAGHGLDYPTVGRIAGIEAIEELNIGFAIVARAVFVGLEEAVRTMRAAMSEGRHGDPVGLDA